LGTPEEGREGEPPGQLYSRDVKAIALHPGCGEGVLQGKHPKGEGRIAGEGRESWSCP